MGRTLLCRKPTPKPNTSTNPCIASECPKMSKYLHVRLTLYSVIRSSLIISIKKLSSFGNVFFLLRTVEYCSEAIFYKLHLHEND